MGPIAAVAVQIAVNGAPARAWWLLRAIPRPAVAVRIIGAVRIVGSIPVT